MKMYRFKKNGVSVLSIVDKKVVLNHSMYYNIYYGALWSSSLAPIYYQATIKSLTVHSGKRYGKKYYVFGTTGWYDLTSVELAAVNTEIGQGLLLNEIQTQYDIPEPYLINGYQKESVSPTSALQVRCVSTESPVL